ncbi:hypothetical protein GCM10009789_52540 [Kribbella sancticallisti]|uniref:Uncharacterized protein n=1 Tax=Kribbella sancticallisti TaxID=460087 RepID=A0ABP4Q1A7_9ACTN
MKYEIVVTPGDSVELVLADDLPLLKAALKDCIGTHPCRSEAPPTYWIDRAIRYLELRLEDSGKEPLASGNATYLQVRDGIVEARYEFAPDDDRFDAVPAEELLGLLRDWRRRVANRPHRVIRPRSRQIPLL